MKSETKQIGDFRYCVTQVSSGVGLECAARLANLLGPGFAAAPESGGFNSMTLGAVLGKLLSNPDLTKQLAWFVDAFGSVTQVFYPDGKTTRTLKDVYETHFAGEIAHQLEWLRFAFEVNMHSFFEIAQKLIAGFWALQKGNSDSISPSPAASSGAAGA